MRPSLAVRPVCLTAALAAALLVTACNESSLSSSYSASSQERARVLSGNVGSSAIPTMANQSKSVALPSPADLERGAAAMPIPPGETPGAGEERQARRRVEERRALSVQGASETPSAATQAVRGLHQRALDACRKADCDVQSARIDESASGATATLSVRIAPQDVDRFVGVYNGSGFRVVADDTTAVDRTLDYVDVEARLTALTTLRDRLYALLAERKDAKLDEILQVHRELASVNGQIDATTGRLRALALATDKTALSVTVSDVPGLPVTGSTSRIADSFANAWKVFDRNLAAVIEFVVALLPWIPVLVLVVFLVRWIVRLFKGKPNVVKASSAPVTGGANAPGKPPVTGAPPNVATIPPTDGGSKPGRSA